ncbi:hypothetical protein LCGC14_1075240 [marine sediment metagenome]|uniref:Uncharacterized protein n=1 Tax=marine sediment metagenome TaxID=412755 RepID=A0A0F9QMT3_9ZZZZ
MIKLKDLLTEKQDKLRDKGVAVAMVNKMQNEIRNARAAVDKSLRRLPNNLKHAQKHGYESELMEFVDALQTASNALRAAE